MSILRCHRSTVGCGFRFFNITRNTGEIGSASTRCRLAVSICGDSARHEESFLAEALQTNEAPALDPDWATADCKRLEALQRSHAIVPIHLASPECVAALNGAPVSPSGQTVVFVRPSAKYCNVIGTAHTHRWLAFREPQKTWTAPLMGWTSSSDPYAAMAPLTFPNESSAVMFCEKNGYSYNVQRQPPQIRNPIVRRYENNFHWTRRCRLSTR